MKIVQATFGVFHHFELARELHRRGYLDRIYSTFPWLRLQREGVPRHLVETFPWVQTTQVLLGQKNLLTPSLNAFLAYHNATSFDRWTCSRIPLCDALIALSGAALETGKKNPGTRRQVHLRSRLYPPELSNPYRPRRASALEAGVHSH